MISGLHCYSSLTTKETFPLLSIAKYFRIITALIVICPLNPADCIFSLAAQEKDGYKLIDISLGNQHLLI
jgi:hypothetical protein